MGDNGDEAPLLGSGTKPRSALWVGECDVGRGLFARRVFETGDLILVFRGARFKREDPVLSTATGANLLQTGPRSYILPREPGLFVNHSCNPNAGVAHRQRLVAIRRIDLDEEIRFDYSTTMDEDSWTMPCLCGQPNCRKTITDFKYLPPHVRSRYIALGVVPKFIARRAAL